MSSLSLHLLLPLSTHPSPFSSVFLNPSPPSFYSTNPGLLLYFRIPLILHPFSHFTLPLSFTFLFLFVSSFFFIFHLPLASHPSFTSNLLLDSSSFSLSSPSIPSFLTSLLVSFLPLPPPPLPRIFLLHVLNISNQDDCPQRCNQAESE